MLPKPPTNNDFPGGLQCPRCGSRDTVVHPNSDVPDDNSDFGCNECLFLWNEDSAHGTTVVIGVSGKQPDFERENVISIHVDHDVTASAELAAETLNVEEGDEVDIVHLVYSNGCDSRIVTDDARIKSVGPMQ